MQEVTGRPRAGVSMGSLQSPNWQRIEPRETSNVQHRTSNAEVSKDSRCHSMFGVGCSMLDVPHPDPPPGEHAQFPEFSRPLVWNCFMGTHVGCYSSGVQCAKFFREFLHRGEGRGGKRMWRPSNGPRVFPGNDISLFRAPTYSHIRARD